MERFFPDFVRKELASARERHQKPINSAHEGWAVIREELDEFWEEVRKKRELRSVSQMLAELVQVAAMAQRTAEDLKLAAVAGDIGQESGRVVGLTVTADALQLARRPSF